MIKTRMALLVGAAALLAGLLQACSRKPAVPDEPAEFAGAQACASCHPREYQEWSGSDHRLAMQPASEQTVLGDFGNTTFTSHGLTSRFSRKEGKFLVETDGPDGRLHEYEIAYTFGRDPLQQYLIAFPKGRYQALTIAWDTRPGPEGGQRWFPLHHGEPIDSRDSLHWTGALYNWNSMCAECHSTNLQKNYREADDSFATTFSEVNVACEACHGPGSRHVAWAQKPEGGRRDSDGTRGLAVQFEDTGGQWTFASGAAIGRRATPPSSAVEIETCARCHARRSQVWSHEAYGQPLAQTYRVALLDEPLYHPDGQIRDEVYEYGSFLQSRMHRAGVTCSNCHDPHSGRLRRTGNAVCLQCHLPGKYDGRQHHFHQAGAEGAQCVSCHMIARTYMGVDSRRDHSFRVPRPDLSVTLGTPNACNDCHRDRSSRWAADAAATWYGAGRTGGWHYADALHAGRTGRADAESQLVRAVQDANLPAIVRATALDLLPRSLSPASLNAVDRSLGDSDPLVRRAAAAALSAVAPQTRLAMGLRLLNDPIRAVRLEAISPLVDVPARYWTKEQVASLDAGVAAYRQAQLVNAERAESHANLGVLDARLGRLAEAEGAYRKAIQKQASFVPAYINLADLYSRQGRETEAEQTLRQALQIDPSSGDASHALGLSFVRQKRLDEALALLEKAARLRPDVARYAYTYAVALHDTKNGRRALDVLRHAYDRHPANREILAALAGYSREAGDRRAAIGWAERLVALSPGDEGARRLLASVSEGRAR